MRRFLIATLALTAVAGPATADTRYLAYDAADRITQALTRGVTLEVERGLFGAIRVERIISTSQRGEASITRGGPEGVRAALPAGSPETSVYRLPTDGDARALGRALCPGADASWLVLARVRLGRPLTAQAVGRWADGTFRHCVTLSYSWRGEWAMPPRAGPSDDSTPGTR